MAEALGGSDAAVSQWRPRAHLGGPQTLRHRPSPGAPRRLSADQLAHLSALLPRGPAASGFRGALWTPSGVWRGLPSHACGPSPSRPPLESPEAEAPGSTARRSRHGAVARRDVAGDQQGAEAQPQTILSRAESGVSLLPSVVRPDAPVGQTPILQEGCIRDHRSAISAISLAGKLYVHRQDCALTSDDVGGLLEPRRREVPGRTAWIWDGAPIHRRHTSKALLAHGAAQRLHLERLPT